MPQQPFQENLAKTSPPFPGLLRTSASGTLVPSPKIRARAWDWSIKNTGKFSVEENERMVVLILGNHMENKYTYIKDKVEKRFASPKQVSYFSLQALIQSQAPMELAGSTCPILLHAMSCNDLQLASNKSQKVLRVQLITGLHVVAFPFFQRQPLCLITPRLKAESISRHFKVQTSLLLPTLFYRLFSDLVVF